MMQTFALLVGGVFQRFQQFEERPEDIPHKAVVWLPVEREFGEAFEGIDGDRWLVRVVDPASLPPPVPASVSPRQARLALLAIGKLAAATAAIQLADEPTRISWEYATMIVRADPGVIAFAEAIGLDAAALDAVFVEAENL
jgi:hypothetical protein